MRVGIRVKYGVTPNLELRSEIVPYFGNLARGENDIGFSEILVGAKYRFDRWPGYNILSATGFNISYPLGNPPEDLTDGYTHFMPYIVFSRHLDKYLKLKLFTNTEFDFIARTSPRDEPLDDTEIRDHSFRITVGGNYQVNNLKYILQLSYRTTELFGGDQNHVFLSPGFIWDVPKRYTSRVPGRWQLGAGIRLGLTDDDENFQIHTNLKVDFDLS